MPENQNYLPPPLMLEKMIHGFQISRAISVCVRLGIPDHLRYGPRSIANLAEATDTHPDALGRLMRALTSIGVFAERTEDGTFAHNLTSLFLRTDHPHSLASLALINGEDWAWNAWGKLEDSVRTGRTAIEHLYGLQFFDFLDQNRSASKLFNQVMALGRGEEEALARAYNFSTSTKVVDMGGGHGALLLSTLKNHPHLSGVVFDLENTTAEARKRVEEAGLADRCAVESGNFFEGVPSADTYILKYILHDWSDADAERILESCRRAIAKDGNLLVIESIRADGELSSAASFLDLSMLLVTGGRERTLDEYRELLSRGGFSLVEAIPLQTFMPLSLLLATPYP